MKLTVKGELFDVELEGNTAQEVWQQAAFWASLPTTCPVDDKPTRFGYKKTDKGTFYYLESTGPHHYEFQFGTRQDTLQLFPGKVDETTNKTVQRWVYYDGEKNITMWEEGRLLRTEPPTKGNQPPPQQTNGTSPLNDAQKTAIELETKRVEFDRLGTTIYNTQWSSVRGHNIERITAGKTSDYKQLNMEQLDKLIDGLKSLQKQRAQVGK